MAFSEEVSYSGQNNISTFNGNISLETAKGRLVVRDNNQTERTTLDILGLTVADPDGTQRLRAGIASSDGRSGFWDTKTGKDLRDNGI